jgi:peroxiredoxin
MMKSSSRRSTFLIAVGLLICVVIGGMRLLASDLARKQVSALKDKPAPAFALVDLDGNQVELSDFQGRPVLINFWATWCPPCREEMPDIVATYEKHKGQGLMVLAISSEESAVVRGFAGENKMNFPVLLDSDGAVSDVYRIRVLPTSIFVNKDGVIVHVFLGSVTEEALEEFLGEALND